MRTIFSILILIGLAGLAGFGYVKYYRGEGTSSFRTAPVERGNMLPTIEATGSLEPEEVVDIGSQVNGLITELKADFGSNVETDQVLATVDDKIYKAIADQNEAAVSAAKGNLALAKANAKLAQENFERDKVLLGTKGALTPSQSDADVAACESTQATVVIDEAAIKQADAMLRQSQTNLGYCNIRSPVKGTIVDRRVNKGQTVVSSLSASSLFLLAKDLSRIQVWASVNEADIGRIHPGLKVHFKVDAYPNDTFEGEVAQIRLNATMTQNVVTYTVVVTTQNPVIDESPVKDTIAGSVDATIPGSVGGPHYKLLPYMTASLTFEIDRHENVLKVPNAALRWKPQPKQIAPDIRSETLAAMNRPKKTDDNKDEAGDKPAASPDQNAGQNGASPGEASPSASAAQDSSLATSGGTATGLNPVDWKARMEKKAAAEKKAGPEKKGPAKAAITDKKGGTSIKDGKPVPVAKAQGHAPGRPITPAEAKAHKEHHESARLWIVDGNYVRPVHVKIIATDGTMTEVQGKDVHEGMEVVIRENVAAESDADTTNPFMPKFRGNSKSSGNSK
jgi:HlyD family secretion protein